MDFSLCKRIVENISHVIVGKEQSIELLLVALLADGHVLIEDIPGLGKTLIAKCLARSIGGFFRRIQFSLTCYLQISPALMFITSKRDNLPFKPDPS